MALARIRTIKEAYAEIKASDPKTAISQNYIRALAPTLPSTIKAGRRFLVNMDELESHLNHPSRAEMDRVREYETARNKIRPVGV